jgi:hypothetical protein
MAFGKLNALLLLILVPAVICLSAGLYFSVRGGSPDIDAAETGRHVKVSGRTYFAVFSDNHIDIFNEKNKKLIEYEYGAGGSEAVVISSCISDLDADNSDEILLLTGDRDNEHARELLILEVQSGQTDDGSGSDEDRHGISLDLVYRKAMADLNPWKVQTCDVDGDSKTEISLGVYKTAVFHPVMAKRPFIYEWNGNAISPKWLGSRLARPFDDYIFADIDDDGIDELISIEHLKDGRKAVNSYSWKGFGFEGDGESDAFDDILSIAKIPAEDGPESIEAHIVKDGKQRRIILHCGDDKLEYCYTDTINESG